MINEHLSDSRQGTNKKFPLADLLRQSVYSRLAGYADLNDAVRVSSDPTFRLIGSKKNWDRGAALTSRLHGFETEMLASEENLIGLMAVNRELVAQAETQDESERIVLDMDSTESPVHGQQEGSAYNGHFESVCYHPLLLFNQHGDCLAAKLRPGNVHSAEDWDELLLPEIERQQAAGKQVAFRGDAAFAKPEVYEASEERGVQYAIRIPANRSLELEIEDILFRPPGRPGRKPLVRYKSFRYQAESWKKPRRVVAKVEHHQGELFARVGFIVTNMSLPPPRSVTMLTTPPVAFEPYSDEPDPRRTSIRSVFTFIKSCIRGVTDPWKSAASRRRLGAKASISVGRGRFSIARRSCDCEVKDCPYVRLPRSSASPRRRFIER